MFNCQPGFCENDCPDCARREMIEAIEFWVSKGERTFWNWRLTLTDEQRVKVDAYMRREG